MLIFIAGQKGGSFKSTLARALTVEAVKAGLDVFLADFDPQQQTSFKWSQRRSRAGLKPDIEVSVFHRVDTLMRAAEGRQVTIVDGGPHASEHTLQCAQRANLVLIPTGTSIDDLEPALNLGRELQAKGVQKILFAITKATNSEREIQAARDNIAAFGFACAASSIRFSTAYSKAQDEGRAISETRYETLNTPVAELLQSVFDNMGA